MRKLAGGGGGPVHVFACFVVVVFSGVEEGLAKRSYETMLAVQLRMSGEN